MIGFKRYFPWSLAVFTILFFTKCTQQLCEEKGDVELNAGFYTIENSTLADTLVDSISLILGENFDTIYYEELKSKTHKLAFPLSITSDTSKILIKFDLTVTDTLTFVYKRDLRMISHECGFVYYFELINVETTTNKIKSVWVNKTPVKHWTTDEIIEYWTDEEIKNGHAENIKIYL